MTLLIDVFKKPQTISQLSDLDWDTLTGQAKASGLLGRLYYLFSKYSLLNQIPSYVIWHYQAAYQITERLKKNALREIDDLSKTLQSQGIETIFLKGAAYQVSQAQCHYGRYMSDIDLLVQKEELPKVQRLLLQHGWLAAPMDDYDQKYYREWMHEIPPLYHIERETTLDVHHNILPLTNENAPKASDLTTRSVTHSWCGEVNVLCTLDTVIHSAVHLFTDSEFHHALRDLSDLDWLITEYSQSNPNFVMELVTRANDLGLSRYIWLALTFTKKVFNTNISEQAISQLNDKPTSTLRKNTLLFSYEQIFLPNHKSCRTWKMGLASEILFWRSHLIKMPLRILIPHLCKKSYKRIKESWKKDRSEEANNLP